MAVQPVEPNEQERLRHELDADLAAAGITPMTTARLTQLASASPWESDDELEAFLNEIYAARQRD